MEHLDPFREYLIGVGRVVVQCIMQSVLKGGLDPRNLGQTAYLVDLDHRIVQVDIDMDGDPYWVALPIIVTQIPCNGYVATFIAVMDDEELASTVHVRMNQLTLVVHYVTEWQWSCAEYYPVYTLGRDPEVISGSEPYRFGSRRVRENPFQPDWAGFHVFTSEPPDNIH